MQIEKNTRIVAIYIIATISYRIVMDWSYSNIVSVYYSYMGFYNNESPEYGLISWFCLLVGMVASSYCFCNYRDLMSTKIVGIMYLVVYVPFTSLTRFGLFPLTFIILNLLYWLNLLFFNWVVSSERIKVSKVRVKQFVLPRKYIFSLVTVLSWVIVLYISGEYAHFHINFNLENVYELRLQAKYDMLPGILRYGFGWSRAALLVSMAYYSKDKKYLYVLISFLCVFLSFGYDGSKGIMFASILIILINLVPGKDLFRNNRIYILGIAFVVFLGNVIFIVSGNLSLTSFITRRMLYTPALLNWAYFDYFQDKAFDLLRGSFLRHLGFTTPYPNLSVLVGEVYGNGSSANNGLFGDAYAHFGALGVIIFPVFIVIFLRIMDKCTEGLDSLVCLSVSIYMALALVDSGFFTTLLSHGLIVMALLFSIVTDSNYWRMRRKNVKYKEAGIQV